MIDDALERYPVTRQELKLYGTSAVVSAFMGGLAGGIVGSVQGAPLGRSILRPASLFSFYTFSILSTIHNCDDSMNAQ
jgi:hypothetical protein